MGGGVLYVLESGDITCSGEVLQGDWTPCEDNIVLKNWPILYFLDKRLTALFLLLGPRTCSGGRREFHHHR